MSTAFESLTTATQHGDAAGMQEANAQVREGLARFESGLVLRRALAEGRAPLHGFLGLSWSTASPCSS
jgi:hypothetical protein